MAQTKKLFLLLGSMVLIMIVSNCSQDPDQTNTSIDATAAVSSIAPTATEVVIDAEPTEAPLPTLTPDIPPTDAENQPEETIEAPENQSIPDSHNYANATYSLDDEQTGPSPVNVKEQLGSFAGGGGGRFDLPNNCLTKHFGITYYEEPTLVEALMAPWYRSRSLQPIQKDSVWLEGLPDVCACGFDMDEVVTLSIANPEQHTIYEDQLIAQLVTGANGEALTGVSCVESDIIRYFDFLPTDPAGTYELKLSANSGTVSMEFKLEKGTDPYFYYSERSNGYILGGFAPNETMAAAIYEPSDEFPGGFDLARLITVTTDEYGTALLIGENTLAGDVYQEDADLQAPLAIFRGDPTTEYFEVLSFYDFFSSDVGFVIFYPEADFEKLVQEFPENPYLYYHQGNLDRFVELAPDSPLAADIQSTKLYEEGVAILDRYLLALRLQMREVSDAELEEAIGLFNEAIELAIDPTLALIARADANFLLSEYALALEDIQAAGELNPSNPYFPVMEGNVHLLVEDYPAAVDTFEQLKEIQLFEGYFRIGCAYQLSGDDETAAENFLAAVEIQHTQNSEDVSIDGDSLETNYYGFVEQSGNDFRRECLDLFQVQQATFLQENPLSFDPSLHSILHPIDSMQMLYVPAGEFTMGSLPGDPGAEEIEFPQHTVYLDGYWIDYHEVTVGQYALCVEAGICASPAGGLPEDMTFEEYNPVTDVTWGDAATYCGWAGRRLPTEAEWEKAARGVDARPYPWGDASPDACSLEVVFGSLFYLESIDYSCPAPSGALSMAGNAWEWVADYFSEDYYSESPYENPLGPAEGTEGRVVRGGSYTTTNPDFLRTANRWFRPEDFTRDDLGFRCVLSDSP